MRFIRTYIWAFLNTISLLSMLWVNYMANAIPIAGKTTGQLSAEYPNMFVPAGITFAIWGLIYATLIGFVLYQWYTIWKGRGEGSKAVLDIGPWFLISCGLNIGWIFAWHHEMLSISVLTMIALLITLAIIFVKVNNDRDRRSRTELIAVAFPFSLYFSWITVALVANITALLVGNGFDGGGFSEAYWASALIFVATLISMALTYSYGDLAFAGVTLWALMGIIIKQSQGIGDDGSGFIVLSAWISVGLVAAIMAIVAYKKRIYWRARKIQPNLA